jgi:lysophospholipase L1-like esterase
MKQKVIQVFKIILVNYIVFVTLLVTIEIVGQCGWWLITRELLIMDRPKRIFEEHPYLSAVTRKNVQLTSDDGKTKITTDTLGFRVTGVPASATRRINVVCLGGSTTFGAGVTDEDTWPYVLQQKLGGSYAVYNLGVPGYSTAEAIIQLATIIPELKPDVIILYEGWNDIRNYHIKPSSADYFWHGQQQKHNLEVKEKSIWHRFFLTRMATSLRKSLSSDEQKNSVYDSPDVYVDSVYTRNLRTIHVLGKHLNAKMIFIPQVLNFQAYLNAHEPTHDWTPNINNRQMPALMRRFNTLMKTSIRSDSSTLVLENVADHAWETHHFTDYGHFSREGGERFATLAKEALNNL